MKKKKVDKEKEIYILGKDTMNFLCWYQKNEKLGKYQFWSGSVIRNYDSKTSNERNKELSDVEGELSEYDTNIINGLRLPESRYLYGFDGINLKDNTISFTVFPEYGKPMDYMFKYDEEENMFYGVWFYIDMRNKASIYGGYARLELMKNAESNKDHIISDLWRLKAYCNNIAGITYMVDNKVPTLLPHEEVDDSIYQDAKNYFKKNAKTLQLFYEPGE